MTNEKFKATLLTEDAKYSLNDEVAESFQGMHINSGPQTESLKDVVGVVDDCWHDGGIIAEVSIYDEEMAERMEDGEVAICPTVSRDLNNSTMIRGMDVFVSQFPGEFVGEVEKL